MTRGPQRFNADDAADAIHRLNALAGGISTTGANRILAMAQSSAAATERPTIYGQRPDWSRPRELNFSSPESWNEFAVNRSRERRHAETQGRLAAKGLQGEERASTEDRRTDEVLNQNQMKLYVDPVEYKEHLTEHGQSTDVGLFDTWSEMWHTKSYEAGESKERGGHGAGMYDLIASGEKLRNPVRAIVGQSGGQSIRQWEGHHRIAAAADVQADTGEQQLVPIELHSTKFSAQIADLRQHRGENRRHQADWEASVERRKGEASSMLRRLRGNDLPSGTPVEASQSSGGLVFKGRGFKGAETDPELERMANVPTPPGHRRKR